MKPDRRSGRWAPKLAASLVAAAIGWISGFLVYVAYMTFLTPWERPTDSEAILFWTAIFISLSWLLFLVPLVLLLNESASVLRFPKSALLGGIAGVFLFLGLVGWWTGFWEDSLFLSYAAVVGAATGAVYWPLAKLLLLRFDRAA